MAGAVARRDHAADPARSPRSRRDPAIGARLGAARCARRARAEPHHGAERLAHGDRLCRGRDARARGAPAGDVRGSRDAARRRRQGGAAAASPVAGRASAPGDQRPRRVLGDELPGGARRDARALSQAPLAGGSARRDPDATGKAASGVGARRTCVQPLPPCGGGRLHLTEAPISPRPIGERPFDKRSGGPAPQAWEGEGGAQISRCFLKQTRRRRLPLTFPSLTRWVPSSPRGERKKGTSLPVAIPVQATLAPLAPTRAPATWGPRPEDGLLRRYS